jgi:pimeloyl-ACP methyl ester carboxylesterase
LTLRHRPNSYWLGDGPFAIPVVEVGARTALNCFIFVPPFAEEMNRSRRLLSLLSHKLANNGHRAILYDLPGTGDSQLDFAQARLSHWIETTQTIMSAQPLEAQIYLIGVRFGAALAASADDGKAQIAMIAPVMSGASTLRTYTRISSPAEADGSFRAGGYIFSAALTQDLSGFEQQHSNSITLELGSAALPWLQIEPEDAGVLAESLAPQLLAMASA